MVLSICESFVLVHLVCVPGVWFTAWFVDVLPVSVCDSFVDVHHVWVHGVPFGVNEVSQVLRCAGPLRG